MKHKKLIALMWGFSLLSLAAVFFAQPFLPDQVPVRWSFNGQVTAYAGKGILWGLAAIPAAVSVAYQAMPHFDPKKNNYEKFQLLYDSFGPLLTCFFFLLLSVTLTETLRPGTMDVGRVVIVILCLLFLLIGSMLGKVKSNWFMGFRTPWALSDPDVWNKTQRMGGWVFFLTGLITLPLALLARETVYTFTFFALLFGGILFTCVMSWRWFRIKSR